MKKHRAVMENDRRGSLKNWPRFEKSRTVWVCHFFHDPCSVSPFPRNRCIVGKTWQEVVLLCAVSQRH